MPRAKKVPKPVDPNAPPPKSVCTELICRYLKTDQTIYWARELPAWYRLWKLYPSLPFWYGYKLPFGNGINALNHMTWFESIEGVAELKRAWTMYHYIPAEPRSDSQNALDSTSELEDNELDSTIPPPPVLAPRRAKTIAELLSSNRLASSDSTPRT